MAGGVAGIGEEAGVYHCISRVVDRRFVLGVEEKEHFRMLMRMQEKFTGCRVVSYCLMDNHFHLLLEVPPMAEGGLSDGDLLKRLGALYSEAFVAEVACEIALWANDVAREYRKLLMAGAVEKTEARIGRDGAMTTKRTRKGMSPADARREQERAGELSQGRMLRCRVRYFTDGAVIGSRAFVNEAFASARERFGGKRRDGARKMRGDAAVAAGVLWSLRDLRKGI